MTMQAFFVAALLSCGELTAQTVSFSITSAQDRLSGSILLKLDSPAGKSPVALQWKFRFPPSIVVEASDLVAGSAAEAADKMLTCVAETAKRYAETVFRCILIGGQKPISDGSVATVHYRITRKRVRNSDKVTAQDILGVGPDTKPIPIPNAEVTLASKYPTAAHRKPPAFLILVPLPSSKFQKPSSLASPPHRPLFTAVGSLGWNGLIDGVRLFNRP